MLCPAPGNQRGLACVSSGEATHLRGLIDSYGEPTVPAQEPLQVTGSVTEFKDASPFDEWDDFPRPALPMIERYQRGDEIVGERELMIKKLVKNAQKSSHKKQGSGMSQTLAIE